nr:uncharacterized protein LOC129398089 [Pan paniscus]
MRVRVRRGVEKGVTRDSAPRRWVTEGKYLPTSLWKTLPFRCLHSDKNQITREMQTRGTLPPVNTSRAGGTQPTMQEGGAGNALNVPENDPFRNPDLSAFPVPAHPGSLRAILPATDTRRHTKALRPGGQRGLSLGPAGFSGRPEGHQVTEVGSEERFDAASGLGLAGGRHSKDSGSLQSRGRRGAGPPPPPQVQDQRVCRAPEQLAALRFPPRSLLELMWSRGQKSAISFGGPK